MFSTLFSLSLKKKKQQRKISPKKGEG
jgi:hypothetical protein